MTNKTTLKRLKLDPYFSKTIETNLNVWSHDQNSYEIKFEFYDHQCNKPIDLTGADMRILLDHADSKPKIYPLEIESKVLGLAKFIMPEEIRGCEGKFTAHIYADYPNKTHDFGSFIFYTKLSRIDKGMGGCLDTVYVSEFEKALRDIKDKSGQFDDIEKDLNDRVTVLQQTIENSNIKTAIENLSQNSAGDILSLKSFGNSKLTQLKLEEEDWIRVEKPDGTVVTGVLGAETNDRVYLEENETYFFALDHRSYFGPAEMNYVFIKHNESGNVQTIHMNGKDDYLNYSTSYGFFEVKKTGFHTIIIGMDKRGTTSTSRGFYLRRWRTYRTNVKVTSWVPSVKELATKSDITVLQKQVNEIKNAITSLGGTL